MKKHISVLLFGLMTCACHSPALEAHEQSSPDHLKEMSAVSSISMMDGTMKIDSAVILDNANLGALAREVERAVLTEKRDINAIPPFIMNFLRTLADGFSIANPGEEWQAGCTVLITDNHGNTNELPKRQLDYFGMGENVALMTYFTGGLGKMEHIVMVKFQNNMITDFWCGLGFADPTKNAILKYVEENKDKDWGLNTNIIWL